MNHKTPIEIDLINILKNRFNIIKQIMQHDAKNHQIIILLILKNHESISINDITKLSFQNTVLCTGTSEVLHESEKYQKITFQYFENINEKIKYENEQKLKQNYDHRALIESMKIGVFLEEHPGFITLLSRGLNIFDKIKQIVRKYAYNDFQYPYTEVRTPPMMNLDLWKKTGHYQKYRENMFICNENESDCMALKPMSCPSHTRLFANMDIKQLPFRIAEFGECFRNEAHGGLQGLKRARFLTQDDGHIFCLKEHICDEIDVFLQQVRTVYSLFKFNDIKIVFATRPENNFHGSIEDWNSVENDIIQHLNNKKYLFEIAKGEGAFYGPKIEIHIQDLNKRYWQCGTIQIDWFITQNLNAAVTVNQKSIYPIVLHRAIFGSLERFLAILLETHHGLPAICNDIPVIAIVLHENAIEYTKDIQKYIPNMIIDTDMTQHISDRIRKHHSLRPNYMIVIGSKDVANNVISIRKNNENIIMNKKEFIEQIILETKF